MQAMQEAPGSHSHRVQHTHEYNFPHVTENAIRS